MKKLVFLMAMVCLIFTVAGCSNGVPQAEYDKVVAERDALRAQLAAAGLGETQTAIVDVDPSEQSSEPTPVTGALEQGQIGGFDSETVISKLEVAEYSYVDSIKTPWTFLVITNNSEFDIRITINVTERDADGNMTGVSEESERAFESGSAIVFTLMHDEKPATLEYAFSVEQENFYECVLSDLTYEVTPAKNKAIVSTTNNGSNAAEFVKCTALFFAGDTIVGFDNTYFTDDDNELKAGATINKEMSCYSDFDSVQVYFTGRR